MPFDPFKKQIINRRLHVVGHDANGQVRCVNCGVTGIGIVFGDQSCEPDGELARAYRKERSDGMVGRVTGNSKK